MRILLTANASYDPPKGGSTRSNLMWLAHLARRGHACRVVCGAAADYRSSVDGIEIVTIADLPRHASVVARAIEDFQPDWVLVSSEDLSHTLLRQAAQAAADRIVYLAHTPQWYPFGPASWYADPQAAEIVSRCAGIVAIGAHMAGYIQEHLGRSAQVIHPPIYGDPPYPRHGRFGEGAVLMINPCAVKGISIFLELARRFPNLAFAALEGWGTTSADRDALAALPNVQIFKTVPSIDEALSRAQLLLAPSLWYEGFGLIVMEAMLRGLPVIASDSGGLQEAKRGTRYVIPVEPIRGYRPEFDEAYMPVPVLAEQNLEPWAAALQELTSSRDAYEAEAARSLDVAAGFVNALRVEAFEEFLLSLRRESVPAAPAPPAAAESRWQKLSPAQRALLLAQARRRGGAG